MQNAFALLSNMIEKEPGWLMGPVDSFMGFILNVIFNVVHALTSNGALGVTIIIFTILIRLALVPSGIKMQKGSLVMKKLQPEMEKIKKKYGTTKDPEIQRKMQGEINALYASNNYNPLSGCLPLLVTLPIFMALNYLLRQPFMFIDRIGVIYEGIAVEIMKADNYKEVLRPLIDKHTPGGMTIYYSLVGDIVKALNKFTPDEWNVLTTTLSEPARSGVISALAQKTSIESFLGLNLLSNAGWGLPGIIIPVLSAGTQFLSAFYGFKVNPPGDQQGKTTQMMMMIFMPLMMGYFTVNMSMGVGIYWVMGNIFMFAQQVVITRIVLAKENKN